MESLSRCAPAVPVRDFSPCYLINDWLEAPLLGYNMLPSSSCLAAFQHASTALLPKSTFVNVDGGHVLQQHDLSLFV